MRRQLLAHTTETGTRPGNQKILPDEAQELRDTEQNVSRAWIHHRTISPGGSLAKRNRKAYQKSLDIFNKIIVYLLKRISD